MTEIISNHMPYKPDGVVRPVYVQSVFTKDYDSANNGSANPAGIVDRVMTIQELARGNGLAGTIDYLQGPYAGPAMVHDRVWNINRRGQVVHDPRGDDFPLRLSLGDDAVYLASPKGESWKAADVKELPGRYALGLTLAGIIDQAEAGKYDRVLHLNQTLGLLAAHAGSSSAEVMNLSQSIGIVFKGINKPNPEVTAMLEFQQLDPKDPAYKARFSELEPRLRKVGALIGSSDEFRIEFSSYAQSQDYFLRQKDALVESARQLKWRV